MLTNEQIEKLDPLTKHPKFGILLQEAMNIWEGSVNPNHGDWGIYLDLSDNKFRIDGQCCLIGASLVNKKVNHAKIEGSDFDLFDLDHYEQIRMGFNQNYDFSNLEFNSLWKGFDAWSRGNDYYEPLYDEDAFQFGLQVRKILFPDE